MKYKAAWAKTQVLTCRRYKKLMTYFTNLEDAWKNASETSLLQAGFDRRSVATIMTKRRQIEPDFAEAEIQKFGLEILCLSDVDYPKTLSHIADPPVFLYLKGNNEILQKTALAVVGSRKMSPYGQHLTQEWVSVLAQQGLVIVSGLAMGIDAIAHEAALSQQAYTLAVLGSGIDQISPRQNYRLAQEICKTGALLSEFAPGIQASEYTFPRRNRIISGLSVATLVVEAGEKSGALITASQALDQNREVFAIPGDVRSAYSKGTNQLIAKGEAKLVTSPMEILEELGCSSQTSVQVHRDIVMTEDERKLYNILELFPKSLNELVQNTAIQTAELQSLLTLLEMKGVVKDLGQGAWVRV